MNIKYLATIQDGINFLDKADDLWFEIWNMERKIYKLRAEEKELRLNAIKKLDEAQILLNQVTNYKND